MDLDSISKVIEHYGYEYHHQIDTGPLFVHATRSKPAILLDTSLYSFTPATYHYVHYTSVQNRLMHQFNGVLRFLVYSAEELAQQLPIFLNDDLDVDDVKIRGQNREEQHIDPTPPEYNFALIFEQVFGAQALHALKAETSYIDRSGMRRFIDYELTKKDSSIAIELNGESYHHPLVIGERRYKSQLLKQNSLVSDGKKVFRWSNRGMADETKITDQLREYFGSADEFVANPAFMAKRDIASFELYEHQDDALRRIADERANGKSTFLVVLPTGTGKTEVFIEDMNRQFEQAFVKSVLVLVPTKELKQQTIARIQNQLPHLVIGDSLVEDECQVVVQTNALMLRRFRQLARTRFDYILVDEAHRAAAHGLRKVLEHFAPKTLVGLTATDKRLDKQRLEEIFGSYEVDLTLEQAIKKGIVPPIRAFRLQSNIDLSNVRFNGKDFVKSELNRTVQVPSRDQLIVNVLNKYFFKPLQYNKPLSQGIVFCVDIKHTERMAKLLNQSGISAASVHGKDRTGVFEYEQGKVRFLCACELLNEGWDAPQTEVVVMARPTMSKVLYTQQLGRGTRNYPGKEALYVIDVVDSYSAALHPYNVHSLLQVPSYMPFGDVIFPDSGTGVYELTVLEGLYEHERRMEPVNIFSFDQEYGNLLNEEQLARELFISTGTVKAWVKKGEIQITKSIPFGRSELNYFSPETVSEIRFIKGLKERTDETRFDDFFEFLEQKDYTFSYKIVFLLAFLRHLNEQGEAELSMVTLSYQMFYRQLLDRFGRVEKTNNPLNSVTNLENISYLQRSMLQNPFEKFERKRFIYHCKDLALISFDTVLWERFNKEDLVNIQQSMVEDGIEYFNKVGIPVDNGDFHFLL